jgi:hypothetical protein
MGILRQRIRGLDVPFDAIAPFYEAGNAGRTGETGPTTIVA